MKNRSFCLFFCLLLFLGTGSELFPQNYSSRIQQIRKEVRGQRDEPAKITKLMGYARQVYREAPELAKEYARGATVLADHYKTKQKEAYTSRGFIHYTLGEFSEAAKYMATAASFETDPAAKANLFEKQGTAYARLEQYDQAVAALNQARALYQQAGKTESVVGAYNALGQVRFRQEQYQDALKMFEAALPLARTLNNSSIVNSINRNIQACKAILQNTQGVEALRIESLEVQEQYEQVQATLEEKLVEIERAEEEIMSLQEQKALQEKDIEQQKEIIKLKETEKRNLMLGGAVAFALMFTILVLIILLARNRKKKNEALQKKNEEIEEEKTRSESLLLSILPAEAAEELKEKGSVTPREFQQATLIFTDFVQFTQIAEGTSPDQLIKELNHVFATFDDICTRHNLEKIKTIGDAYMAAGGLPIPNTTHAEDAVRAALEMQAFMWKWRAEKEAKGEKVWELRIGIHTGKVVAGVIGKTKFAYDVWGDTVNVASRMEASGEPWKVNISRMTYELVKEHFICVHRGQIPIKHKGPVDMYFVQQAV